MKQDVSVKKPDKQPDVKPIPKPTISPKIIKFELENETNKKKK